LEYNFANAESFIRDAAARGCDLAVLPEYHLTSWCPSHPKWAAVCAASATYLAKYSALAAELAICIVPGTLIDARLDGRLYNVAYFVAASGAVLARYQKKNLWHPERPHLAMGEDPHTAFDAELGGGVRVGLLICWDLAFPEAFRQLIVDGAKIIVVPAYWLAADNGAEGAAVNPDSERLFLTSAIVARAFENTACVVFVNVGGPPKAGETTLAQGKRDEYVGLSQVAMPLQGAVGKLGAEEGMEVVEVDLDVLEVAEQAYKVRSDALRDGWHYSQTMMKR
jgi:predicted amidohydrolase